MKDCQTFGTQTMLTRLKPLKWWNTFISLCLPGSATEPTLKRPQPQKKPLKPSFPSYFKATYYALEQTLEYKGPAEGTQADLSWFRIGKRESVRRNLIILLLIVNYPFLSLFQIVQMQQLTLAVDMIVPFRLGPKGLAYLRIMDKINLFNCNEYFFQLFNYFDLRKVPQKEMNSTVPKQWFT